MASKFDRLRAGEVVELDPSEKVRLNLKDKKLESSKGWSAYVGDNEDYFPSSEQNLQLSREKEKTRHQIGKIPGGEFFHQLNQQGIKGGVNRWIDKIFKTGEEYTRSQQANQAVSQEISERSPWTSGLATASSLVPEIAATGGMPAVVAAPLTSVLSAGPRVIEEPGEVAKETAISTVIGLGADAVGKFASKAAARRADIKGLPAAKQVVQAQNVADQAAIEQSNLQQAQAHQKYLSELPKLQKEAQAKYGKNIVQTVEEIEKQFPKNARIIGDQIGVQGFIDDAIDSSALAGSREGSQASKILKTLFKEDEIISAKELAKKYQAIEGIIQKSEPALQNVLSDFKNYLGQKLPTILEDSVIYSKMMPKLPQQLERDIAASIKDIPSERTATGSVIQKRLTEQQLNDLAKSNLRNLMKELTPSNFVEKLRSGEIAEIITDGVLTAEDFAKRAGVANLSNLRKGQFAEVIIPAIQKEHDFFTSQLERRIKNTLAANEIKAAQAGKEASKKIVPLLKKTYGLHQPIAPKSSPLPQTFVPQPEPTLSSASGVAEQAADFLEKPLPKFNRLSSPKTALSNLAGLGGLKYILGSAAAPVAGATLGAYGAAKALTSPGIVGQATRATFKEAGIHAIQQLAEKYPSYRNGILDDPRDRRSLTKEIEDDSEIPIEKKAIFQSLINRGKPLNQSL